MSALASLPLTHSDRVHADWIDYNGHMNVAYYVLVFDKGTDGFLETVDMTPARRLETGSSVFVAEAHINYLAEAAEGDALFVHSQVLGHDPKRLHLFHTMTKEDGTVAATTELMILHVDLNTRRVCPFPDSVRGKIADIAAAHAGEPTPAQAGRRISVKKGA